MNARTPGVDCDPADLVSALRAIGGKWKVKIVCLLLDGKKRFGQLRRSLRAVHRGTLSYELRHLERDGIVRRTQFPTMPPTVEYELTAKGTALKPALIALSRWVEKTTDRDATVPKRVSG